MNFDLKKYFNSLLFIPLGGANEIGMNVNLYHLDGKWIMVDLGVGFAYDIPGVDMMTADISFIKNHKKNLLGIILTHIHEDHLGAVQYLWQELEVPVYTSNFTANFLRVKLEEFDLTKKVPIKIIDDSTTLNLDPFFIDFIGLTHSVPEMKALVIKTRCGNILHTGDWKFDPDPVIGKISDKEKIASYGKENQILAMVCDSTNAISTGHSRSEGELYDSLKTLITGRNGLVGVTTFASNIARIHTIARIGKELGRKIVLSGYSLNRLFEVGKKSGYFTEEFDFISDRELKFFKKNEVLIIATGCQGEALASTRKIAFNLHPTIRFTKGDLMIFSSKIIPGNERKIFELFNQFAKRQIDVMTEKDHFVHVSGHPSQAELIEMYQLAKPKVAIPVHGEFIHTKTHCDLAIECGISKAVQVENGSVVKLSAQESNPAEIVGVVQNGYLAIDGKQLISFESEIIKERKKLKYSGIVIVSLVVNSSLNIISEIRINSVGCYDLKKDQISERMIEKEIKKFLENKSKDFKASDIFGLSFLKKKKQKNKPNITKSLAEIERSLRSKIVKIFEELLGKKPAVEVIIHLKN
jgi:ribonuclease J